jgi:hypothetical protein
MSFRRRAKPPRGDRNPTAYGLGDLVQAIGVELPAVDPVQRQVVPVAGRFTVRPDPISPNIEPRAPEDTGASRLREDVHRARKDQMVHWNK